VIISASSSASPASSAFYHQFLVMQGLAGRTMEKEDQPTATRSHELEPRKYKQEQILTPNWMLHCIIITIIKLASYGKLSFNYKSLMKPLNCRKILVV
jgi:hypothetical protein